jgi:ABC-type multidrug transport system ATPase subunit
MGSSGAGKTSLLNMISDRITNKKDTIYKRKVLINDETPFDAKNFGKIAGYVMQDDVLFEHFSPREALIFAARLKLTISVAD